MDAILQQLTEVVPTADSLENLTRPLLEMLGRITGLESTYLTSIDLEQGVQHIDYVRNTGALQMPEGLAVPWGDTLCKRSLDEGRSFTNDVPERWADSDAARALGIHTYLSTPVRTHDGRLLGTLCGASAQSRPLSPSAEPMLQLFSRLVGNFVEREMLVAQLQASNARLSALALTDALTDLPNRRAILDQLPRLMAQARRDGTQVLVAVIDLDEFKRINDTHGHQVGDAFLKETARRMQAALRASDMLGRLGGDEFMVLAPGACEDPGGGCRDQALAADALRRRLETATTGHYALDGAAFDYAGASVGIAAVALGGPVAEAVEAVIHEADAAMYAAKQARKALKSAAH